MMTVGNLLKIIEEKAFEGIKSENISIRLKSMYEYALQFVPEEKIDYVIADIVDYESKNAFLTLSILDVYSNLSIEKTLSDFSAVAMHFAQNRGKSGKLYPVATYMMKGFMRFVDNNEEEIEKFDGLEIVSETLLDFNYSSGNSDNLSFRMRAFLM